MNGQARRSDPFTSHVAAALTQPGPTHRRLLAAHSATPEGLTDEEAATRAGLSLTSEYATRCSELMREGLLRDTDQTRPGSSGKPRLVRVITSLGLRMAAGDKAPRQAALFGDESLIRAMRRTRR